MNTTARNTSAPHRRWLGNLSLIVVSLVGSCLVAELALLAVVPDPIVWLDPQESYVHDPELIHRLKPNQQSFTHSFPVKTNSFGLRNSEFSLQPNANTFRILCLGDSLTFGNGVTLEDTYPKQLEAVLNSDEPGKYEVINGGVPAYDTWQEVAYLKRDGVHFKPNLVVIGVYANDIVPRPKDIPEIIDKTGFPRKPGMLGLVSYKMAHLLKRSRLLLLLRDRYGKLTDQLTPSPEYQHKFSLLNDNADAFLERGWSEIERSFAELANLSKKYRFEVVLVLFPMADQVMKNYPNASYPSKVKVIADRYHIRYVDMTQEFTKNFSGFGSLFIEWDGHPNAKAYNLTANEIARFMQINRRRPS
jgi:lysophospholipase L1-like esterase